MLKTLLIDRLAYPAGSLEEVGAELYLSPGRVFIGATVRESTLFPLVAVT